MAFLAISRRAALDLIEIEQEKIYVLTVKHGSMDLPERIGELEPRLLEEAEILRRAFSRTSGH